MTDLSQTIAPKSDQLNADDLLAGPRTITITGVRGIPGDPQPVAISFEGDNGKPFKPCKSMRRVLVAAWGPNGEDYVGRSMTLYCDPNVRFGGIEVGGIRISHLSDISERLTIALTVSRAKRKPYTVNPLAAPPTPSADPEKAMRALLDAQAAASGGRDAFRVWWNGDGRQVRHLLTGEMDGLKAICAKADAATDDDPMADEAPQQEYLA